MLDILEIHKRADRASRELGVATDALDEGRAGVGRRARA
jgi:hypothetical protein